MFQVEVFGSYEGDIEEDILFEITPRMLAVQVAVGNLLISRIRAVLNQPGSGVEYPSKFGGGRKHVASAPGQTPAPDRGEYKDSWVAGVEQPDKFTFAAFAGTVLWEVFGRRLELGGFGGGVYIAPRPHIRKIWDESEEAIQRLYDEL